MKNHLETGAQKLLLFSKRRSTYIIGIFLFSFLLLPMSGFCDISSALNETKSQVQNIISAQSGLFWIFMAIILGGAVWTLYKGNWKALGVAVVLGILLGNFSDVIDALLGTKVFKNKSSEEQSRNR